MPAARTSVSLDFARLLVHYARLRGGADLELPDPLPAEGTARGDRLPAPAFERLWEAVREHTRDPDFGLHLGEFFTEHAQGHILFSVMRNCPDIGEALEKFFRYHGLITDVIRPHLHREGSRVSCRWRLADPGLPIHRHHVEAIFSITAGVIGRLSGGGPGIAAVRFTHARPPDVCEHRRIFEAPVRFSQHQNALMLPAQTLARPIEMANPEFLAVHEAFAAHLLRRQARTSPLAARVVEIVEKSMLSGRQPEVGWAARELAMSTRSLQAALAREGTTYRRVLNETRRELARHLLEDPGTSLCDIAFLLGFSEQSAFNPAFRRWTGSSPGEYRRARTGRAAPGP